jgi:hypothetical protein
MDSSPRTGAAIADGWLDVVSLRDLIEREGGVALREPEGIGTTPQLLSGSVDISSQGWLLNLCRTE